MVNVTITEDISINIIRWTSILHWNELLIKSRNYVQNSSHKQKFKN